MNRRIMNVLLVGLLVLAIGQGVLAHGPGMGRGMRHRARAEGETPSIMTELGLSDDQQKALRDLRKTYAEENQGLWQELSQLNRELDELWSGESLDAQAIKAKETELVELKLELAKGHRGMHGRMQEIFTSEQWEKVGSLGQRFRQGWGSRGYMGAHHGRGMGSRFGRGNQGMGPHHYGRGWGGMGPGFSIQEDE